MSDVMLRNHVDDAKGQIGRNDNWSRRIGQNCFYQLLIAWKIVEVNFFLNLHKPDLPGLQIDWEYSEDSGVE